jgi:hypothetical protein
LSDHSNEKHLAGTLIVQVPQHHGTNDQSAEESYIGNANLEIVTGSHHHTPVFLRTMGFEDHSAIGLSVKVAHYASY